eukprot:ANDGO_00281.mRNA.1 hypothetical protein
MINEFVVFVFQLILFIINLIIDIVCICFLVASFVAPWRIPSILASLTTIRDRVSFRGICCCQLLLSISDVFCLVPLAIALAGFWRWHQFIPKVFSATSAAGGLHYNPKYRLVILEYAGNLLMDIPSFACAVVCTFSVIRTYPFYRDLSKGRIDWREVAVVNFLLLLLDLLMLPASLIIVLTGYRFNVAFRRTDNPTTVKYCCGILFQAINVLIDIPFFTIGFVAFAVNPWRWKSSINAMAEVVGHDWEQRYLCIFLLGCLLLDICVLILFLLLLILPYRFIACIFAIRNEMKPPVDPENKWTITTASLELPDYGMILRISGTKPAGMSFQSAEAHIVGESFFHAISSALGSAVSLVLKSMLPISLAPKYWNAKDVNADATTFESELMIETKSERMKKAVIVRKMKQIQLAGGDKFTVHVEFDHGKGTLFDLSTSCSSILAAARGPVPLSWTPPLRSSLGGKAVDRKYLCWVAPKIVGTQLLMLLLDLLTFLALACAIIMPWRFFWLLRRLLSSEKHFARTELIRNLRRHREIVFLLNGFFASLEDFVDWTSKNELFGSREVAVELRSVLGPSAEKPSSSAIKETFPRFVSDFFSALKIMSSISNLAASCSSDKASFLPVKALMDDWKKYVHVQVEWTFSFVEEHRRLVSSRSSENRLSSLLAVNKCPADSKTVGGLEAFSSVVDCLIPLVAKQNSRLKSGMPLGLLDRSAMQNRLLIFTCIVDIVLDFLCFFTFLFILGSLYRFPLLLKQLFREPGGKRNMVFRQGKEIGLDVLMILESLLILGTLYLAIDWFVSMSDTLLLQHSVKDSRMVCHKYVRKIGGDLLRLLNFIFAWSTFKLLIATVVWGIFAPAQAVFEGLKESSSLSGRERFVVSTVVTALLYCFPVVLIYAVIPSDYASSTIFSSLSVFFALLLLPVICNLLMMPASYYSNSFSPSRARFNVPNAMAWAALVVEIIQLVSLVWFAYLSVSTVSSSSLTADSVLHNPLFRASLFDFPTVSFPNVMFWVIFAIVLLFFVLSSAPIVLEDMLRSKAPGDISQNPGWFFWISFLTTTMFEIIVVNLVEMLSCRQSDGRWFLSRDSSFECWDSGRHRSQAVLAMVCLAFYVPTASFLELRLADTAPEINLDIQFSTYYVTITNVGKLIVSILFPILSFEAPLAFLCVYFVVFVFLALFTLVPSSSYDVATIPAAGLFRGLGYGSCAISSLLAIISVERDPGGSWMWIALFCVWVCAIFVFGAIVMHRTRVERQAIKTRGELTCQDVGALFADFADKSPPSAFIHVCDAAARRRFCKSCKSWFLNVLELQFLLLHLQSVLQSTAFSSMSTFGKRSTWKEQVISITESYGEDAALRKLRTLFFVLAEDVRSFCMAYSGSQLESRRERLRRVAHQRFAQNALKKVVFSEFKQHKPIDFAAVLAKLNGGTSPLVLPMEVLPAMYVQKGYLLKNIPFTTHQSISSVNVDLPPSPWLSTCPFVGIWSSSRKDVTVAIAADASLWIRKHSNIWSPVFPSFSGEPFVIEKAQIFCDFSSVQIFCLVHFQKMDEHVFCQASFDISHEFIPLAEWKWKNLRVFPMEDPIHDFSVFSEAVESCIRVASAVTEDSVEYSAYDVRSLFFQDPPLKSLSDLLFRPSEVATVLSQGENASSDSSATEEETEMVTDAAVPAAKYDFCFLFVTNSCNVFRSSYADLSRREDWESLRTTQCSSISKVVLDGAHICLISEQESCFFVSLDNGANFDKYYLSACDSLSQSRMSVDAACFGGENNSHVYLALNFVNAESCVIRAIPVSGVVFIRSTVSAPGTRAASAIESCYKSLSEIQQMRANEVLSIRKEVHAKFNNRLQSHRRTEFSRDDSVDSVETRNRRSSFLGVSLLADDYRVAPVESQRIVAIHGVHTICRDVSNGDIVFASDSSFLFRVPSITTPKSYVAKGSPVLLDNFPVYSNLSSLEGGAASFSVTVPTIPETNHGSLVALRFAIDYLETIYVSCSIVHHGVVGSSAEVILVSSPGEEVVCGHSHPPGPARSHSATMSSGSVEHESASTTPLVSLMRHENGASSSSSASALSVVSVSGNDDDDDGEISCVDRFATRRIVQLNLTNYIADGPTRVVLRVCASPSLSSSDGLDRTASSRNACRFRVVAVNLVEYAAAVS